MNRKAFFAGAVTGSFLPGMLLMVALLPGQAKLQAADSNAQLLKREEMMVYNLNRGPKSARFYQLESLKATRLMQHHLELAQHQVEQVDAAYARIRNKPDDRTMQPTVERLKTALQTAQQLETQLKAAGDEMKSDIQQTLIR
jgi:hypothetical protein